MLTIVSLVPILSKRPQQLLKLFEKGGFFLRKWNSSDSQVVCHIKPEHWDTQSTHHIPGTDEYTKTLGNVHLDYFRLTVARLQETDNMTKRAWALISGIARTFDVLGWFAPSTIKAKILLQWVWESGMGWDDLLIHQSWLKWRCELHLWHIPCYYHTKCAEIDSVQLNGFCDASKDAYSGVMYIRGQDRCGNMNMSLVISKTKVAP